MLFSVVYTVVQNLSIERSVAKSVLKRLLRSASRSSQLDQLFYVFSSHTLSRSSRSSCISVILAIAEISAIFLTKKNCSYNTRYLVPAVVDTEVSWPIFSVARLIFCTPWSIPENQIFYQKMCMQVILVVGSNDFCIFLAKWILKIAFCCSGIISNAIKNKLNTLSVCYLRLKCA